MNVFGLGRLPSSRAAHERFFACPLKKSSWGARVHGSTMTLILILFFFAAAVSVIVSVCFAEVIRFLQRPGVCIVYGAILPRSSDFQPMME